MTEKCGCCEGIHQSTPAEVSNRPGLSMLQYRTGTHAKFLETMKARLSNLYLKDAEPGGKPLPDRAFPLGRLKTRDADDPAIAFLDAWATVADVLTFYQERIANEGYLRTATERRSVLELARLVGYSLRPGVAASTYLAYTLEKESVVTIPSGSRAQSVPGPGETLQSFETSDDLAARTEWNILLPRRTSPQSPDTVEKVVNDALYFKGITTNLKPNDALLVDYGTAPDAQQLFRVMKVEPEPLADRTKVTLALWVRQTGALTATTTTASTATAKSLSASAGASTTRRSANMERVSGIVERFSDEKEFGELLKTNTGKGVAEQLEAIRKSLGADEAELARVLDEEALPRLQEAHTVSVEKKFTRLEPWIQQLIAELTASIETSEEPATVSTDAKVESSKVESSKAIATTTTTTTTTTTQQQSRENDLDFILNALDKPKPAGAIPPPSSLSLNRSVNQIFSADSDIATKILTTLRPGLTDTLVTALGNQPGTPKVPAKVYAMRMRASVFGHNAPPQNVTDANGKVIGQKEWTLVKSGSGAPEDFGIKLFFLIEAGGNTLLPAFAASIKIGTVEKVDTLLIPKDIIRTTVMAGGGLMNEYEFLIHYPAAGEDPIKVTLAVLSPPPGPGLAAVLDSDLPPFSLKFEFPTRKVAVTCDFTQPVTHIFATAALDPLNLNFNLVTREAPIPSIEGQQVRPIDKVLTVTGKVLSLQPQATERSRIVALDAPHPEVLPGDPAGVADAQESWVALERPALEGQASPLVISRILQVKEISRADYGVAFKTTQLTLEKPWLNPRTNGANPSDDIDVRNNSFDVIRGTAVFAQSELLELDDAPINPLRFPVCGNQIELDALYSGLETGRWLVITGERADVTPYDPAQQQQPAPDASSSPTLANQVEADAATAQASNMNDANVSGQFANATAAPLPTEQTPVIEGLKSAELVMLAGVRLYRDKQLPGDKLHTTLLLANSLAYCYKLDTVTIYGNVAHATHGETRREVLGSGDASQPLQTFTLKQPPLTYVSARTVSGVESTLQLRVNDILWHEAGSMAELGPNDRRFLTRTDDEGKTRVIFGNGKQGARVPTGIENITALYRNGIGKPGNLKAGQISILATKPLGVKEVINPLPATGGADKEDRDTARRNTPLAVMALDRLVSVQDYEDFTRTFAGIGKVSAARLSDGRRQIVFLTIAGADDIPIDETSDLFQNLRLSLQRFGDPFQAVQIKRRLLKLLVIDADVCVQPDYLWEKVEPQIRAALLQKLSFAERELGQDVLLSEVISAIQLVEGVLYVDVNTLGWVNEDITAADLLNLGKNLTLRERIKVEMARIDETATTPGERIRPAELAVLSPLVPDTLILRNCQP